ncbi:MAG: tRNA (adenosine(37)-N6)-dimethylallyltransferase MiaA [Pseudomonadota bacterium]
MSGNHLLNSNNIDVNLPVLIAGPTASGKSAAALELAQAQGRNIVNADALQVYGCWRVLSARPSAEEEAQAPHLLYGHVSRSTPYSVGHWLREVQPLLTQRPAPIIIGGTGLYFRALTEGLAEIPETPPDIRHRADEIRKSAGHEALLAALDAQTAAGLDQQNPMRVQRAWEVQEATGKSLSDWQKETPPPLLPLTDAAAFVLDADKDWLNERIERRFDIMMDTGAMDEARAVEPDWLPSAPWAKAIGAPELIAHLRGELSMAEARAAAVISTRQYAKRQRTWFRARMGDWNRISVPA